jgi:ketosteroid isomerase-like protein
MFLSAKTREAVTKTMYAYASAYGRKDVDGVAALLAPEVIGIGSEKGEWVEGCEGYVSAITREFAGFDDVSLEYGDLRIAADGIIAWVATPFEMTVTAEGRVRHLHGVLTAVLMNTWDGWRFVQTHFSVPEGGEE